MQRLRFALVTVLLSFAAMAGLFLAADTYAHYRFDGVVGLNRSGYRGPLVSHDHAGIKRIVVLGGSTAFGYGVPWQEAWPAQLERELSTGHDGRSMWTIPNSPQVVNLGYNAEGAYSFRPTLEDYAYLKPDLVILYEGYNDLGDEDGHGEINTQVYRRQSPLFRLTGYYAILPLVLHEKWLAISSGGHLDEAYRSQKIVFHPGMAASAEIGLLRMADVATTAATGPLTRAPVPVVQTPDLVVPYVQNVHRAILYALTQHAEVLVVGQPLRRPSHERQQRILADTIRRDWGGEGLVRYVGLGYLFDFTDQSISVDKMHLTAKGNAQVAAALAQPVREMIQ